MKKYFRKIALLLIAGLAISCEQNEIPTIDDVNGPTLAQFSTTSVVLPTPEDGASTEVEVFVTTVSSEERVIQVSVDPSSTATAEQYEISDLVIPANSYSGTITITSNYSALPETGNSNLVLNLVGVGSNESLVENGQLKVQFFRTCPIVPEEYVGTWSGTTSWDYPTEVVTSLNEEGELMINGLTFGWFQDWWGEVIVTNAPVKINIDAETGEITIPQQPYITSTWNGAPQPAYEIKGTGKVLNPCEKVIELFPVLVQGGSAIDGSAYGPAFKETITLVQ